MSPPRSGWSFPWERPSMTVPKVPEPLLTLLAPLYWLVLEKNQMPQWEPFTKKL